MHSELYVQATIIGTLFVIGGLYTMVSAVFVGTNGGRRFRVGGVIFVLGGFLLAFGVTGMVNPWT